MKRREFVALLGGALATRPAAAFAETTDRARRIGYLNTAAQGDALAVQRFEAFKRRLGELNWAEGRNLRIDVRFGNNDDERVRQAAKELAESAPDAILSTTSTTTLALMRATRDIPIVAAISGDPIALGFTKSLSRPTGNVTGFPTFNDTLPAKQLEMLRQVAPPLRTAALMWAGNNPQQALLEKKTREAAQVLGVELISLPIKTANDIAPALAMARDRRASAIIVAAEPLMFANARAIIDGCVALKLPAIHTLAFEAKNGALMSYGSDAVEGYRLAAEYIDRILRGAKIADLPFQQPTRLTLAINLKTARALGITIPLTLLALADEVIE
jgi:putative ABC transport system substrate-binding protein